MVSGDPPHSRSVSRKWPILGHSAPDRRRIRDLSQIKREYKDSKLEPTLKCSVPAPARDGSGRERLLHLGGFTTLEGQERILVVGSQGPRCYDPMTGDLISMPSPEREERGMLLVLNRRNTSL
jgi:hypothetical protein